MSELDVEKLKLLEAKDAWDFVDIQGVMQALPAIIAALEDRDQLRAALEQIAEITAEMGPSRMKAGEIARAALEGRNG